MAHPLQYKPFVPTDLGQDKILESLAFEARGEASNQNPAVLSCGGIYIPKRTVPKDLKTWRQIVNLPGPDFTAKIFGLPGEGPGDIDFPNTEDTLGQILKKESLN